MLRRLAIASLLLLTACGMPANHADPVLPVLLVLLVVLVAAKGGGEAATRLGQPAVLGELVVGIALGVVQRLGAPMPDLATDPLIDVLARLGVIVLLFEVGLESTVPQLLKVGGRATVVATLGVILPILGGFGTAALVLPGGHGLEALFLGAAMCATSVGITARVFQDLGARSSGEARLIVGAAVIDDVLGLVVLSLVIGFARATQTASGFDWHAPLRSVGLSALFLSAAIFLGPRSSKLLFRLSGRMRSPDLLLPFALAFAFALAAIAGYIELAPIVGAYAAGLVLERAHYESLIDRGEQELEELVHPIGQVLTPVFFVVMGARVNVFDFASARVWVLALALIAVAMVTKLACGLAAPKNVSRLVVGLGMIPRGEVGLIFADAGRQLVIRGKPLLSQSDFSAIVLMVAVTTLVTPPFLGAALRRTKRT